MNEYKRIPETWTSIRDKWPFQKDTYEVFDCIYDIEGTAFYDGAYFHDPEWHKPKSGHLMAIIYKITHWRKSNHFKQ